MFLQNKFHRNVDRDCSWIFPLLADKEAKMKVQIFVLRKDTADILGKNQHLVGHDISLNSIHPAAWAQEKAKSLGILDLSPSHIEKLSGDNTRQEKDRVMAALMTGYYLKQQIVLW